ncbi:MAG: hypothetical protein FJ405_12890 [Verrucomicrobia bacterium]|nr:hypothetical protein [Verrucomicrobiota bacterium]
MPTYNPTSTRGVNCYLANDLSLYLSRHQGRGQLAFVDSHVEAQTGQVVVTNGLAPFPPVGIIWTPDPSWNPNTERPPPKSPNG